jgi:hypothetical protein
MYEIAIKMHIIFEVFSFNIWANSVRHCEELIREDWKKLMGNLPVEDITPIIIQLSAES